MSDGCPRCKVLEAEIERLRSVLQYVDGKAFTDAAVLDRYMAGDTQRDMGGSFGVTSAACGQRLRRVRRTLRHGEWLEIEVARYRALMARKAEGERLVTFPFFRKEDLSKLPADVVEHLRTERPREFK